MRKHFNYDFINKTIIGTKAAINRANKGLNPEYNELTEMLTTHPDFRVAEKNIQKKEGKKTYSNLTFKRMKEYISLQDNSKEKLIEFEAVKAVAEAKGAKYPLTKKWFLATYEEYKESDISESENRVLGKTTATVNNNETVKKAS